MRDLACARDIEAVSAVVRGAARELAHADGVTFVLRLGDECYYADEEAIAPLWKGRRFPLESCISGWAMLHRQIVAIADIYQDSRIPHELYRPTFVKSLVMVPVSTSDPIAAIGAYWADEHVATDTEVECLVTLADGAALALDNVQLYGELRAALDREREARARAEDATRARDDLLASVAHELRQPVHAALAALRLMAARTSREQGSRARAVVERQVERLGGLVDDLLDAARVVRGHVELRPEVMDLRETILQVVETVRPMMTERALDLAVAIPRDPLWVRADDARIQQVLMNILANGAKYTERGGSIRLEAALRGGREIVMTVSDNGRGIEQDMLPRVFELFTRSAADGAGFGVGLAVARGLVELHGGTIEAQSDGLGKGSRFTVRLPAAEAASAR
jgi:two-component system CheB/CheR fusion protein